MKQAKVIKLDIPPGRRVLAISDIHANRGFLEALLDRAGFCGDDLLVLLGDFVEKRAGGLDTLRYVMELSRRENVIPLCGNCDDMTVSFVEGNPQVPQAFYDGYFSRWGEKCLLVELAAAAGVPLRGPEDYPALRAAVRDKFTPELAFLQGLPTIALSDRFLFVHGGVPREADLEGLEAWRCMKNDDFLSQGHAFRRWCVVGHWPVTLYHPAIPIARPLICRERRIISIDGGCSVTPDGQLNALILPGDGSEAFAWTSWDGLPTATALDPQAPSPDPVNVRYAHNELVILQAGGEFCRCRHLESGRVLDVLTAYLHVEGGRVYCEDATDYRLPVAPGDVLSVVRYTSRGILAKRAGVTGWYAGRFEAGAPAAPVGASPL